jgi:nicotinate-nucleotide adenylyltransferase
MNAPQRIGLFGGTFDPFHQGHLFLIQQATAQASLDRVIVLPCQISPHKSATTPTSFAHRLAMAQIACADSPNITVDDFEGHQPPPSYSWRTVEHFRTTMPESQLFWILGYDQWQALPRWANAAYLAEHLTFLVLAREHPPEPRDGWKMLAITGTHPASATALRSEISPHFLRSDWLHPNVKNYIHLRKLYPPLPPIS